MSAFPPPPPWTAGFRAQRAAMESANREEQRPRKSRTDKWEWIILTALIAVVALVLILK